ncbi:MAG: RagB/SusD family nutrient uptake outer membrane protein [Prolixibacteraceae bacterium]
MRSFKIFALSMVSLLVVSACKFLEPENDNHSTFNRVYNDPSYAEGLLIRAFTYIPTNDYRWDEVATDDAVTNDKLNSYMRMAKGEWSALYDPQNLWDNSNRAILYINEFLSIVDTIDWKWTSPEQNKLFIRRLKGESFALRGMFKYYLLRNHGGFGSDGALLGTPIYNEFLATQQSFAKPRNTFAECVASSYADFAEAQKYLPMDYGNLAAIANLPAGFSEVTDINSFNTVMGDFSRQRVSGRIVKALKARLALLAASPAFNAAGDATLWQNAANYTAELLTGINGVSGLDPKGHIFYLAAQVTEANLSSGDLKDLSEILWRRPVYTDQVREVANFPPSLYGNGRVNPTQNLVDAFPMANGYPITDVNSKFNAATPYVGRDPRLALYVVYNGASMKSTVINTGVGGGSNALDATQTSTRTGYYLRKLLREEVNANPAASSTQQHFQTHIRYTELYLNYAEAANEAWGPDGKGTYTFSAKDVIGAIRKRAGITQPDAYLATISSKDQMRTLIKNERRIELCFEGFRFWDLRRWKEDLTQPAKGVAIDGTTYTYFTVENRSYDNNYMHYGPIPDKEIIKFNFVQNKGWR